MVDGIKNPELLVTHPGKMVQIITLDLPLPPQELHPNSRAHWRIRNQAKLAWQEAIGLLVLAHPNRRLVKPFYGATVSLRFFFRDRRGLRSDRDNLIAAMKYGFDAIVKSGLLVDDHGLIHQGVDLCVDRKNPRVEVTLREIAL
jgi:Holliday junction resolvase RusA-like endonuclease